MLVYAVQFVWKQKQTNLKLKTWPKHLLGYLSLAFAFSNFSLSHVAQVDQGPLLQNFVVRNLPFFKINYSVAPWQAFLV
jgi:hypothetical protein